MSEQPAPPGESIYELWQRMPAGRWIDLPEYGVRIRAWKVDPDRPATEPGTSLSVVRREVIEALLSREQAGGGCGGG